MNDQVFVLSFLDREEGPVILRQRRGVGLIHALLSQIMAVGKRKPGDSITTMEIRQILADSQLHGIAHSSHAIGDVLGKHGLGLRGERCDTTSRRLAFELPIKLPEVLGDAVLVEAVYPNQPTESTDSVGRAE